ncbi:MULTISPECIES: MATE family efflux transporter [unclassified Shewanella]|uniref:MATE family efflux transporter n=1 Tax=unclassified Shewanella TaxID=196818 RepID=UPI0022BA50DF|nr:MULTISPECIES: MATE family efflux transporter [unclassified Shewanella]MEC4737129.1 MATE family efflux transporter [Shewanella sp. E94]WBJ95678.1 MATE family efflux transporter [Shewanella sp. MTB7]
MPTSINRTFWRYAIPSVAAMLVNGIYQIVDGIFIGQYVGYQGLAGINMAWPIIYVFAGIGLMIGMGSGSLLSINRGENAQHCDSKESSLAVINGTLASAIILILVFGLLGSFALNFSVDTLLQLQGGTGQTLLMAQQYTMPFVWSLVFTILATAIPILIRNDESPNIATGLMVMGACLNIALDYLLIVKFDLALHGAAIATISAQVAVSIAGIGYFLSSKTRVEFIASKFKFNPKLARQILLLGVSSLVMYLYTSFVFALHNRLFMEYGSSLTVGAFAIVGYLMVLYYFIAEGLGEGMQPPVSFFFGADQPKNIKRMVILATKVTISAGVLWVLILNIFPNSIIGLFNSDDPVLLKETITGIQLHLFAMYLDGFIVLSIMYFMAVNQGGKSLFISVANMMIQLPFLYFLPKWLGVTGVWLALPLSNVALFLIVAPMVWKHLNSAINSETHQRLSAA